MPGEIVSASTGAAPHLDVSGDAQRGWTTIGNPHYIATTIDPEDDREGGPRSNGGES